MSEGGRMGAEGSDAARRGAAETGGAPADRSSAGGPDPDRSVEFSVDVGAPPETVFRFLSEPEGLRAWLGEGADVDPVPGGRFRVRYPSGEVAMGTVIDLIAPERLVFTWGYEDGRHGVGPGESRVTLTLEPTEGGTRVTLTHTGLPSGEARTGHRHGWRHYVSVLAARAAARYNASRVRPVVEAFVAAWNEEVPARRAELLDRCIASDATLRDPMACLSGRAQLVDHIEGARRFMPGTRFVLTGEPDHVHDRVRFPWRFEGPDGTLLGSGWNVARMDPDGRLTDLVGFWDPPGDGS